jgi:hypothetical protein
MRKSFIFLIRFNVAYCQIVVAFACFLMGSAADIEDVDKGTFSKGD